jgi:hypothetical protein
MNSLENSLFGARNMAQVVEHLPSKCKAPNPNISLALLPQKKNIV